MISKLQLKAFYESHKDEYYERRSSGDKNQWDEAYKWDIFPNLNEILSQYKTITADNLPEIVKALKNTILSKARLLIGLKSIILIS